MRTFSNLSVVLAVALLTALSSCISDKCSTTETFWVFEPVYMMPDSVRQVTLEEPRNLEEPGKIYVYGQLLFVNELWDGVHIIDNSNPSNPVPLKFLRIPGNVDIAIRNGYLYADNGPDLIAFNLADPASPSVTGRVEGVFQNQYPWTEDGIVVGYERSLQTVDIDCENGFAIGFPQEEALFFSVDANAAGAFAGTGVGGSLARFTILNDYLYAIDESRLHAYALSNPAVPVQASITDVGWGIETIFPLAPNLFIGANDGMYIFSASNPAQPQQLAVFQHARACDPVFVDGDLAYVTLRDGTECQGFQNQLEVIDISTLTDPRLLEIFPMHHPIGLSIAHDHLYLCEDDQGLKVFEVTDWRQIGDGPVAHLRDRSAVDVITLESRNLAIVVGEEGIQQFDISTPDSPELLSTLSLSKP